MEERKLNDFVWAGHYQAYIDFQKKGLRKKAFSELENFIADFKIQEKVDRWKFIDLINQLAQKTDDYNLYLPWNLNKNILQPELREWMKLEPNNPIPYKWNSDFLLLKKSVELNPFDQQTLEMYYTRLINTIRLNQHEIESGFGYSGDPQKDLNLIHESEPYIENITNPEEKEKIRKHIQELERNAFNSIRKAN